MNRVVDVVLASGSESRRRMLADAGYTFRVVKPRTHEILVEGVPSAEQAVALAREKAWDVAARHADALVIGADQVVVMPDGSPAGKPASRQEARAQLRALSDHAHLLVSAAVVVHRGHEHIVVDSARVTFRALSADALERALDWEEWRGTAGGYRLEGRSVHLVHGVEGDHFTVLGLPLLQLVRVLSEQGAGPLTDGGWRP